MDALNLSFAANSFDYVTAFHTVTVVPDPVRMLAEISAFVVQEAKSLSSTTA